jgi:hypothetical protein
MKQEKIYFWGVKKEKISLQSPKKEFGAQNQYDRVIYQKGDNKRSEPKNGT